MQPHTEALNSDIAGAMLHDRLLRSPVASAINAHLNSVKADEAQFDDNGVAYDSATAGETLRAEIQSFRDFCQTPCETPDDVQAKIRYLLNGTVGERLKLVDCLLDAEYGFHNSNEGLRLFLSSLLTHRACPARARRRNIPTANTFRKFA